MRTIFALLSVMLFVALVTGFSPNSPSSPFPSAPNAATPGASDNGTEAADAVEEAAAATPAPRASVAEPASDPRPAMTAPAPQPEPQSPVTNIAGQIEAEVLRLSNAERAKIGLNSLAADASLAATARAHSADMIARGFFDHDNPDGCSSSCRTTAAGYRWRMIGENIHMMSGWKLAPTEAAIMIVNGWMSSQGHRENLLKDGYTESGIGVIVSGEAVYATALYATPR